MSTHKVGDFDYLIGVISAEQQFDITRRLGILSLVLEQEVDDEHALGARWLVALVTGRLSEIPQADWDFVRVTCLNAVQRIPTGGARAVPVLNRQTGSLQFNDIKMTEMLELIDLVTQENLADFFGELRRDRAAVSAEVTQDMSPSE